MFLVGSSLVRLFYCFHTPTFWYCIKEKELERERERERELERERERERERGRVSTSNF